MNEKTKELEKELEKETGSPNLNSSLGKKPEPVDLDKAVELAKEVSEME